MDKKQIRVCLLFSFKNGFNATKTTEMVNNAFGEGSMTERTAQSWFARFRSGDFDLENKDRGRPPLKLNLDQLKERVEEEPHTNSRELAGKFDVHHSTVLRGLTAINKKKKLDQLTPHELSEHDKARRLQVSHSLLSRHRKLPFLHQILTCDEKWIEYDNRRRSGAYVDADAPPMQCPKPNLHPKKIMVTVWWTSKGVVHYSFLPRGQTINADVYCDQLSQMHEKLKKAQPALVNRHGVILLHDNARPHVAVRTVQHINALGYEVLPHPPYSPDLSPTDYHLFRDLENHMRGKQFGNDDEIKCEFESFVRSKSDVFFKRGIEKLVERWEKCVEASGEYFR